jgi:hypothetical protein
MDLPVNYNEIPITERQIVREEYIRSQKGLCAYCGEPLDGAPRKDILLKTINQRLFPPNFFKYPIHLQHSHYTGMTEGVVHCYCNAVLWEYEGR